jgi:hypothetical protein
MLPRTALTNPGYLDDGRDYRESGRLGPDGDRFFDHGRFYFSDRPAAATNQELRGMEAAGGRAGDIRIEAFDAVHQAMLHEKVQCSVNGNGSRCIPLGNAESVDDIVGTDSAVAGGNDLEDATPVCCQSGIALHALLFRSCHHQGDTSLVIVIICGENRFGTGHLIPHAATVAESK